MHIYAYIFHILKIISIRISFHAETEDIEKGVKKLRNVIQDFPVLLTFSFKAYKHVLLLNKGFQIVQIVQSVQSVPSVQTVQRV